MMRATHLWIAAGVLIVVGLGAWYVMRRDKKHAEMAGLSAARMTADSFLRTVTECGLRNGTLAPTQATVDAAQDKSMRNVTLVVPPAATSFGDGSCPAARAVPLAKYADAVRTLQRYSAHKVGNVLVTKAVVPTGKLVSV